MNIAYVRVSTAEQNEQRQIDALKCCGIDRWFTEKVSGKDTNRPQLQAMLDFAREGDTIFVHDFSRLARSTSDLLRIVELLKRKKIHLVSNKENIDTATPTGKLMLTMIGAINEFERQNLLERQREGIAIARANGKYKGRCPVRVESQKWQAALEKYRTRQITKQQMARMLGISRPTLNRLLAQCTPETPCPQKGSKPLPKSVLLLCKTLGKGLLFLAVQCFFPFAFPGSPLQGKAGLLYNT